MRLPRLNWWLAGLVVFVALIPGACTQATPGEPLLQLRGQWQVYANQSAPGPDRASGGPGAGVELPAVVADFLSDPAGQWQLFCRPLPAEMVRRVRAGEALVWHTGHTSDVARFYLDATLLGGIGAPPPEYESGHMRTRLLALPYTALRSGLADDEHELCMALWSAEGFRAAVRTPGMLVGDQAAVYDSYYLEQIGLRVLLTVYILIGCYHFFLFLRRREQLHDLYFAALCFLVSAYFFLASPAFREYFAGPAATLRLKLEFCLLATLAPTALFFIERLLRDRHPPLAIWLLVLAALPWLFILPGAVRTIHYSLLLMHATMLVVLLYMLWRIAREAWRGNRDARFLLIATASFIVAVLHDVLVSHQILRTPPVASLGFAVMLPAIAVLLANRVMRLHATVAAAQRDLEQRVRERTADLEQARERAEEANRAKSRFLASMSHEIRTPLQAMLGAADLIGNSDSPEERQSLARMLSHAGENLSTLVEDTLDHARIEADRMQLRLAPIRLHELLRDTMAMLEPRARGKQLRFDLVIAADVPEQIVGDPGRLSQILLNLLGNALKFTEQGGIELHAERVAGEMSGEADRLALHITDSGPGIPAQDQARIFHAFEQVKDFMARREGGVGLGLAISSRLVTLMGGTIRLQSTPGEGSRFSVNLPLHLPDADEPAVAADRSGPARAGVRGESPVTISQKPGEAETEAEPAVADASPEAAPRLLIAEDNPDIRDLLALYLRKTDWIVEFAEDGREAIETLRRAQSDNRSYDLYVFDMQMPRLDGERLTRILRRRERLHRLRPVVILAFTAHAMDLERDAILAAGCDEVLAKPVARSAFLETLDRLRPRKS